jgi:hypothetical protein
MILRFLRLAGAVLAVAVVARPSAAGAQDCPTAASAARGFVVERGVQTRTEVRPDDPIVRTVMRFAGSPILETTQFQGLFQLDRLESGQRSVFRYRKDLGAFFPLKAGQEIAAEFEIVGADGRPTTAALVLSVRASDVLSIGACKYTVLKIDRSESRGGGPMQFVDTDYYSPDLKLVLAKEFKDRNGGSRLNKFDRISPLRN